jgi:ABC-2 type transport system permease protein
MKQILSIARKELDSYFGSPMALIFVGVFLAATLFVFFWGTAFFARGIADVRPLFQYIPLLMIFLIAALTMRQWSEEQQSGTLEVLLTMPVRLTQYVIGKFLAVLGLVAVALLLTLSLPVTVSLLGQPDYGIIVGGYLAALLLAAAYASIGLFISSRTDNQIVSLIITVIVCGLLYVIGTPTFTGLVSVQGAEILRGIGTGSRFESIERGVIDIRDLLYYVSITVVFLALNVLSLESKRWGMGARMRDFRRNRVLLSLLIAFNLVAFNVLAARANARLDLTADSAYTLSPVTRDLLTGLSEPMLIRAYFSAKTHPLLDPLIPRVRDLLREYEAASNGKITLEVVDPITNQTLEEEANQVYGIRSRPLQVGDRTGTAVVNAYTSILIRYGDQNTVLNILEMIEVTEVGGEIQVSFKNLEYDLTSAIQKVSYGFQSIDAVLSGLPQPAKLTLYYTPSTLPESLKPVPATIDTVTADLVKRGNGKLSFTKVDVATAGSAVSAQTLSQKYQIEPVSANVFSDQVFYFHMLLEVGANFQVIYPSGKVSEAEIRNSIESALKRLAPGFIQVVGIWTPTQDFNQPQQGQPQSVQQFNSVSETLGTTYETRRVNLTEGVVPPEINALVIIAPQSMTDLERYAVDQFLMRGGAVFVAISPYRLMSSEQVQLQLQAVQGSLVEQLAAYGVKVSNALVMDSQNSPFPITVPRRVGNATVQELVRLKYPFFVDVRQTTMDTTTPIMSGLPSVTVSYASPLTVELPTNSKTTVNTLMKSSAKSWIVTDTNVLPNLQLYPDSGFPVGSPQQSTAVAVYLRGSFTSFFKGKPSPFGAQPTPAAPAAPSAVTATPSPTPRPETQSFLTQSPDSARLIVVGSAELFNDNLIQLAQRIDRNGGVNNLKFLQNSVDFFTQDGGLATIRARGSSARLLRPLEDGEQTRYEVGNYVFALLSLIGLGALWQFRKRGERPMKMLPPSQPREQSA